MFSKPRVSPLRFLNEGTESAEVATSGSATMTDHRLKNNPSSSFENKLRNFSNI